ncbi:HD domain-containing phosphohydrolase [Meiothermus rufus]|uniref:HD domain-containing phosphohydrolase n=1 Tax=Meiothermus rufus TaxID=604332 RepID=UPI00040F0449|nr:HD domain-containing phosphohydrolase [Meiothermus rufus]
MELAGLGVAVFLTAVLVAVHSGRERWGSVPFIMLLAAIGLLALGSALFPDTLGLRYNLLFSLQIGLLLLIALDSQRRWRSTLMGLLMIGGLVLMLHALLRGLDIPLQQGAQPLAAANARMGAQGLALWLGGLVAGWLYPRLAAHSRGRALGVVLLTLGGLDVALLTTLAREGWLSPTGSLLLQALLVGPLLGFYLERAFKRGLNPPNETVYTALQSTVEALTQRAEEEIWPRLLQSAVRVVPGAQAGSIRLRQGSAFVFVAQVGFGEGILGLRTSELEVAAWHGNPAAWRKGLPRIANHADIRRIVAQSEGNQRISQQLSELSRHQIKQIRSTLCVPILLGGEVVAEINLDAFRDRAFSEESVAIARQYALQVTVLLAARRQQAELEARIHEFEVIEALSAALRGLKGTREITKRLVRETIRLMNSQHAALFLIEPDGEQMRCYAAAGFFLEFRETPIPQGQGSAWAAIETRAPIWSNQAQSDARSFGYSQHKLSAYSEIVTPLLNSKGQPLGVLVSARDGAGAYLERDVRLLQVIGNIAANTLERVRANESLEAEIAEKTALLELSQLLQGNDPALLELALEKIRQMGQADGVILRVLEGDAYRTRAVAGEVGPEVEALLEQYLPPSHPLLLRLAPGEAFQLGSTASHPELQPLSRAGIQGLYLIGVVHEAELQAGMVLYRCRSGPGWGRAENRLLEGAAQILGALLLRLERTRQLEAAYDGALRAIGLALEARDRETAGHTDRVAALAEQLGRALGLSETELRGLRWGAYLHDVGKLTIPDAILLKPDRLTPEEFRTMKTHAQLGDDLVRNLPFVPLGARQVVRHHHERWDGRGYPDGLCGEQIPLPARIFAICDIFDALCSERPYKSAMPPEQAARELWRLAAQGHLDRRLVEVFLELQGLGTAQQIAQASD